MHAYLEPAGLVKCLRTAKDKIRQRTIEAYKLETNLMKKIIALAVAAVVAAPAMADLTIGGSMEYNLSHKDGTTSENVETNVQFTGMTSTDSGMYVKAFAELEMTSNQGDGASLDDNYLEIGGAAANVQVGEKAAAVAWQGGDDSFISTLGTAAAPIGYTGKTLDSIAAVDTIVNVTAVEGLTVQLAGNVADASADGAGLYVGYAAEGFGVAANVVDGTGDTATDGYAVSASASMGGAALALSYAANEDKDTGLALNVGVGAVDFTIAQMENEGGASETIYYGRYALGNMGVEGFNVDVGAGAGSDAETNVGVEVTYTF